MIARNTKSLYYLAMSIPMRISGYLYYRYRSPRQGHVLVHLGPGKKKYLDGWINVDANILTAKIDVWADFRRGLPFRDETVDAIYSHHVIEHLPDRMLQFHFRELYRSLKPGGVIRIGGPNADMAARKYVEGDSGWFTDFPDRHSSIGGKLANFIMIRNEHLTMLTPSYLEELATEAGFVKFAVRTPITDSGWREVFGPALSTEYESTPSEPHTLIIEAQKP